MKLSPLAQFSLLASVGIVLLEVPPFNWVAHEGLPRAIAMGWGSLLTLFGHPCLVGDTSIYSHRFALRILPSDALSFLFPIFLAGAFTYHGSLGKRVQWAAVGVVLIIALALVRIVSIAIAQGYSLVIPLLLRTYVWTGVIIILAYWLWMHWYYSQPSADDSRGEQSRAQRVRDP